MCLGGGRGGYAREREGRVREIGFRELGKGRAIDGKGYEKICPFPDGLFITFLCILYICIYL